VPTDLHVPRLEDPPLVLRAFAEQDTSLIQEASSDLLIPLITTVPQSADRVEALAFIARQHDRAARGEGYSFAIADHATNAAYGQIGLWLADLPQGRASIGYWIAGPYRRRGLACRALALVSDWALGLADVWRLHLYVEPQNEASWRTAEQAGYRREGLLRSWEAIGDQRRDMYMYSLLPADRRSQPATS
jgi:RimJ/RimL family protein N-acetyltransferase